MTKTEKISKGLLMTALICGTVVMGGKSGRGGRTGR